MRALLVVTALVFPLAACSSATPPAEEGPHTVAEKGRETEASEEELSSRGGVQVVVSVDWEGRDLETANLQAMVSFRAAMPEVRMVQFLNAAYFTKLGANSADLKTKIRSTLLPTDELGLHIHGWKRLFEASGVTFRATPNFWGTNELSNDCAFDCGHEVPISAYDEPELEKVVKFSISTLESHGFGRAKSFRAGGWMARENVRQALVANGITWDSSAVPQPFLSQELRGLPLLEWLGELWSGTTAASQPYRITTPAGSLNEVPDNGALADYVTAEEMVAVFQQAKERYLQNKSVPQVVSLGFHQETAARYLPRLQEALTKMNAIAKAEKIPMATVTTRSLSVR
jgi:hypothetical protein